MPEKMSKEKVNFNFSRFLPNDELHPSQNIIFHTLFTLDYGSTKWVLSAPNVTFTNVDLYNGL